jgi:hypothetical protein
VLASTRVIPRQAERKGHAVWAETLIAPNSWLFVDTKMAAEARSFPEFGACAGISALENHGFNF